MINITEAAECTGCQACRLICPGRCISAAADSEGFLTPVIDRKKCTDCGLCASRCPQKNGAALTKPETARTIGARHKDGKLFYKSASGGVFAGIARYMTAMPGGAVFGCAYDENLTARHICVTDFERIGCLQGSKYVQSDTGDTFLQAKQLLDRGAPVFYTGTPCQIGGLYAFLGADYENLYTADLICHGVPSPLLFKRYLEWLGKKHGGTVTRYNFRSKDISDWGPGCKAAVKTKTGSKAVYLPRETDPYNSQFTASGTLRECCYNCKYAGPRRVGDITLGDFWGVEADHPELRSGGISVVLINTPKGDRLINAVSGDYFIFESSFERAAAGQPHLAGPSARPELRGHIYDGILNDKEDIFSGVYFRIGIKKQIKIRLRRLAPSSVRRAYARARGKHNY